jgi:hypothetical protein
MFSSQSSAHLEPSSSSGKRTGTKTIVNHTGSAFGFDPPRCWPEAGSRLLEKFHLKENIASYLKAYRGDLRILAG